MTDALDDDPRPTLERARALRDALLRAEAMIGLLSVEEAERLPGLYAAAAAEGAPEAWRELGDCSVLHHLTVLTPSLPARRTLRDTNRPLNVSSAVQRYVQPHVWGSRV